VCGSAVNPICVGALRVFCAVLVSPLAGAHAVHRLDQLVAHVAHRADEPLVLQPELGPQPPHMDIGGRVESVVTVVPSEAAKEIGSRPRIVPSKCPTRELPVVLHGQSWPTETAAQRLCPDRVMLFPSSRRTPSTQSQTIQGVGTHPGVCTPITTEPHTLMTMDGPQRGRLWAVSADETTRNNET
jgi:hypothetical protein